MLQQIPVTSFKSEYPWQSGQFIVVIPKAVSILCPHCEVLNAMTFMPLIFDVNLNVLSATLQCSSCDIPSKLLLMEPKRDGSQVANWQEAWLSPPQKDKKVEAPLEVDEDLRKDFKEAALTLPISPRASAVLSRYCLQKLLRNEAGVKEKNLDQEIIKVVQSKALPSYLSDAIDAVRNIGNFGAHPSEDQNTGEIVEVEAAEAEWLLQILTDLFDFYFVKPKLLQKQKDELNEKLKAIGKPPMK